MWLHGYTLDSTIWTDVWRPLDGWSHVGVDLPGHGGSPAAPGETLPELARRLAALACAYDVRHVVALSFGTLAALELALSAPSWLASLTLAAPALAGGPQDAAAARRYEELLACRAERGIGAHLGELWMRSPPDIFLGASRRPALWAQLAAVVARHAWTELDGRAMRTIDAHVQPRSALRGVRAPVLVLIGQYELAAFLRCAAILRASIPVCRALQIPDAGHLCLLEEPLVAADAIGDHLLAHARP